MTSLRVGWWRTGLNFFLAAVLVASLAYSYCWRQIAYKELILPLDGTYITVQSGTSVRQLAHDLNKAGIMRSPRMFVWYAMLSGSANHIKAGEYRIVPGTTAQQFLKMLVDGRITQYSFTIIEGSRTQDVLAALQQNPKINSLLTGLSEQQIISKLDIPVKSLEGVFLADTYYFKAGTTDVEFLRRAYFSLQEKLDLAWQSRADKLHVQTPYEALILASIIEKESGLPHELPEISGVFHRRLAKKMRLQADPTVEYWLGDELKGPLLKRHLKIDSPYNTYMREGLPPTPIAIPSMRAIDASLHPDNGTSIFFVATGNGGHIFSTTLEQHNKAVKQTAAQRQAAYKQTTSQ